MIAQDALYPRKDRVHLCRVYTQWVDAHRCLPLSVYFEIYQIPISSEEHVSKRLQIKIVPNRRLAPTSHCRQSAVRRNKSSKKNLDLQKHLRLFCKSPLYSQAQVCPFALVSVPLLPRKRACCASLTTVSARGGALCNVVAKLLA